MWFLIIMDKEGLFVYENWYSWHVLSTGIPSRWDVLCSCQTAIFQQQHLPRLWHTAERKQSHVLLNAHSVRVQAGRDFIGGRFMVRGIFLGDITQRNTATEGWGDFSLRDREINHPHAFHSWDPPGNNPNPVGMCTRMVDNHFVCPATTSCPHYGQPRNEESFFFAVLGKGHFVHTSEAKKEQKVILQAVKLTFQEPVKIPVVFTLAPAHQTRSEQANSWQRSAKGTLAGQRALSLPRTANRTENARNELAQKGLKSNLVPGTSVPCVSILCHQSWGCQQLWEAAPH